MRASRRRQNNNQRILQAFLASLDQEFIESYGRMVQNAVAESNNIPEIHSYVRHLYEQWLQIQREESWCDRLSTYTTTSSAEFVLGDDDNVEEFKNSDIVNRPDKRSWLTCPVGLEYTFHYVNKNRPRFTEAEDRLVDKINEALPKTDESIVYLDSHCVEIGSPVHRTWKQCSHYYREMIKQAKKHRLTPTSRKQGGGGCHINVSIPKKNGKTDVRFMIKLLCDLVNRPYINWIFNEPSDNHTANNYAYKLLKLIKDLNIKDLSKWEAHSTDWPTIRSHFDDRGMSIRIKNNEHFELRCFDMVRSERDLKDVLTFVSRYLKMVKSQKRPAKMVWNIPQEDDIDDIDVDLSPSIDVEKTDVITEFKNLLSKLKLDYKDYRRFVERNLNKRYSKTYGEEYLK